ncbi:Bug family tripartite tricarboxylate transporter substrate binding protein [Caldimonas thermodepolymerans]|uniref:Bug family tripartite tricarboxylate transporter substrate binding protein n=1 Tax=Caldimonas thermodepolymerans TaxID=215580 RepID=UPI002235B592|nr:tripartite tricarboxylate transporter substrate binding protein [Caldimonas thermodepolymerans]UZG44384.1 tripartite tricarboxylate transporter substrate binding protein [Caldimonas thermodepolymerans]
MKRRALMVSTLALGGMLAGAGWAQGSNYPNAPIRWIVPFPAGGGTDVVARMLAAEMSRSMGTPFVVENKPGAGTMIAGDALARSAPDGYTIGTVDVSTVALAPSLYAKVPYNPAKDLAYVGGTTVFPFVLVVGPHSQAKTLGELLEQARGKANGLSYATPGAGGPNHLGMELLQRKIGVKLLHVPYRGDAPALQDLLSGQVDMYLVNTAASLPHIQAGKLRPLAVSMAKRSGVLPNVPTFAEAGVPDFESYAWQGLAMPAGTPPAIVQRVNAELNKALASEAVQRKLAELGVEASPTTPQQFTQHVAQQAAQWGEVIRAAGIQLEN